MSFVFLRCHFETLKLCKLNNTFYWGFFLPTIEALNFVGVSEALNWFVFTILIIKMLIYCIIIIYISCIMIFYVCILYGFHNVFQDIMCIYDNKINSLVLPPPEAFQIQSTHIFVWFDSLRKLCTLTHSYTRGFNIAWLHQVSNNQGIHYWFFHTILS
jgi:hypothetical protein